MSSAFRIAIVGGGLAGTTLANALLKHPHLSFDVYEAGASFSERGASVGLGSNARKAMQLIDANILSMLDAAEGVEPKSSRVMMVTGPHLGEYILDIADERDRTIQVHRAKFLAELLKPLPAPSLHVNKKLVRVEDGEPLKLHFADGSNATADVVLGADGIHSVVRRAVLEHDYPGSIDPVFANMWDFRSLVPLETAIERLGDVFHDVENNRQWGWICDGSFLMHQIINNGRDAEFVAGSLADGEIVNQSQWKKPLLRGHIEKAFKGRNSWFDGVIECILETDTPVAWSEWESPPTPTYNRGRICIFGDAAHSTTPWQGNGAGMVMEDVMVLEALLGRVSGVQDVPVALEAFTRARLEHTQRVVQSSRETGRALCGKSPEMGIGMEKIRKLLPGRWDFIYNKDVAAGRQQAIEIFDGLNSKA